MGGILYFHADDGTHGCELWRSDGTAEGTFLVWDLVPGSGSSAPWILGGAGGILYLSADDGLHGREPWALPLYALVFADGFESGDTAAWFYAGR